MVWKQIKWQSFTGVLSAHLSLGTIEGEFLFTCTPLVSLQHAAEKLLSFMTHVKNREIIDENSLSISILLPSVVTNAVLGKKPHNVAH